MELTFTNTSCVCLDMAVGEVQNSEQTQEIRLSDGMPDIGRVICGWGQAIFRGKEWHADHIAFSGGMTIWVLYAPEDGSEERVLSSWIPFQMRWELPDGTPEGDIRILCLPRFVDARSISPRKILVRAGMGAMAEAYVPRNVPVSTAGTAETGAELLRSRYPVRLRKEAGEKTFLMDEELTIPDSAPRPQSVLYCTMEPKLHDSRVTADKLVFRGNGKLHMLYRSEGGQLHSWDFEVPFSQFSQLRDTYGSDAQGDIRFGVTSLEPELGENGLLRLKCGVVAQYLITDREMVEVVEDAYSPDRELEVRREELTLPVVLENRGENIYGEQTIQADANIAADVRFLPDFPRQRRGMESVDMEYPGTFQVLYYGEDGILRSGTARWEGSQSLDTHSSTTVTAVPGTPEPQAMVGNGSITVKTDLPVELTASTEQGIPMVTGVGMGQQRTVDPGRPSLVLQRAGGERLWDIAKRNGSTVEAIRSANGLQEEPVPEQMLLIPVL